MLNRQRNRLIISTLLATAMVFIVFSGRVFALTPSGQMSEGDAMAACNAELASIVPPVNPCFQCEASECTYDQNGLSGGGVVTVKCGETRGLCGYTGCYFINFGCEPPCNADEDSCCGDPTCGNDNGDGSGGPDGGPSCS